jgi:competence protein ComFC
VRGPHLPIDINPSKITGAWDDGYCLDRHTISSTMIGYNEFGHPEFDTLRSVLGELIYRLKYRGDFGSIPSIVETAARFIREWGINLDVIIPMPPSKQRLMQPVFEIASALGSTLGIAVDAKSVSKTSSTSQMKDIGDYSARVVALERTIEVKADLDGKRVLLVDDLFQSGASMNVVAQAIKDRGHALAVYAIALTRTRS